MDSAASQIMAWFRAPRTWRWLAVGLTATATNFGLLYLLVGRLGVPFIIAPALSAAISTSLRFLATDRWVFGHPRPTWRRFWEFQIAAAGGLLIWWATSNLMVLVGVHYLWAALFAIGCSLSVAAIAHFRWIWRARGQTPKLPPVC